MSDAISFSISQPPPSSGVFQQKSVSATEIVTANPRSVARPKVTRFLAKSCGLFFAASVVFSPAYAAQGRPATAAEIAAVRAFMQTSLKDADSAKFLDVRLIGEKVCGKVNAKNAFGAYVGFRTFFGMVFAPGKGGPAKTTAYILTVSEGDSDPVADQMCAKEGF